MAFRIEFSEQAEDDLNEILRYINDELFNPQAAERFYQAVDEKLELLREHPYIFPLYHYEKLSAEGFHFVVISNYLMFYIIDDDTSVVSIARLLYGKRYIPAIFENSQE